MESGDERVKQAAAGAILDRGWGKPITMTADMTKRMDDWSDDDIDTALAALRATISNDSLAGADEDPQTKH